MFDNVYNRFSVRLKIKTHTSSFNYCNGIIVDIANNIFTPIDTTTEYESEFRKAIYIKKQDLNKVEKGFEIVEIGGFDYTDNPYTIKSIVPKSPFSGSFELFMLVLENIKAINANVF